MTGAGEASAGTEQRDGAVALRYRGRTVQALVTAPQDSGRAVSVEDVIDALRGAPPCRVDAMPLQVAVARPTGAAMTIGEIEAPKDSWFLAVAANGLAAYAVPPLPPTADAPRPNPLLDGPGEGDGQGGVEAEAEDATPPASLVSAAEMREQLAALGVTHGILEQALAAFDPPQALEEVVCVARGQAPTPGEDGSIHFGFDTDPRLKPVERDDGSVDFHMAATARFVEAGTTLATRRPPVEGRPGIDVRGMEVLPPNVQDHALEAIAGQNTEIQDDTLVATETGRPLLHGDRVDVVQVFEVAGDLDYAVGNIDFSGDVVVRGDVKPDFNITAGGTVVVQGVTDKASIKAGDDITLRGVIGSENTVLEAGGDLVAQYIHNATVTAAGQVKVNGEIVNCTVKAERVVTAPTGRILGGSVTAREVVDTGTLGSQEAVATEIVLEPKSRRDPAVVRARKSAHAGVTVQIGSAAFWIDDETRGVSFWAVAGRIVSMSAAAGQTEWERLIEEARNAKRSRAAPAA